MENKESALSLRDTAVALAASFALFYIGFGQFIFVLPLLLLNRKHGKSLSALSLLIEALLVLIYLYRSHGAGSALSIPFFLFETYIPLSLLAAGAAWLITERKSIGIRLFIALIPASLLYILIFVYLGQDAALFDNIVRYYQDAFEALLGPFVNSGMLDKEFLSFFSYILLLGLLSLLLPIVLCFVCATCFTYESLLHSRESDWEERVALIELDAKAIWIFLALWLMVLLTRFISIPTVAGIALSNVTLSFTLGYLIQGFSVLYYNMRKRWRGLKSYSLFLVLAAIGLFVPGINLIVIAGLPLLGVLETFFELRK